MKVVHEIAVGSGRQYITVQCAGSAYGGRLPPFIGKSMYQRWMQGGPAAAVYGVSESGWMDSDNFLLWFKKLFLPAVSHLSKEAPIHTLIKLAQVIILKFIAYHQTPLTFYYHLMLVHLYHSKVHGELSLTGTA